jgi:histidinol-phosphate aminotransferase
MSVWNQAHAWLRDLVAYEPGKPIEDVARELGLQPHEIIKLASNENPLGPSPKALAAMHDALERAHFYPDGGGFYLREAIAKKFGLARENVVLGCGSNEIIEFIGHAFLSPGDEVIASRHAFVVYKLMATLFGARTVEVDDPGFAHDLDAMAAAITPRTKQIFVANPNNPTGTLLEQAEIDRFMEKVPPHIVVVFDEAYYEFLEAPPDTLKFVRAGKNVIVLRTFSKIQGLANLRIGYGLAPADLIAVLQKTRQPFNANGIAQAGALAGLEDEEHQRKTREITVKGRDRLQRAFAEMELEFVPSYANFVLVKVGDGQQTFQELLRRGIIVRDMNAYGLPEWIRVSIGTPEQNARFLSALAEIRQRRNAGKPA